MFAVVRNILRVSTNFLSLRLCSIKQPICFFSVGRASFEQQDFSSSAARRVSGARRDSDVLPALKSTRSRASPPQPACSLPRQHRRCRRGLRLVRPASDDGLVVQERGRPSNWWPPARPGEASATGAGPGPSYPRYSGQPTQRDVGRLEGRTHPAPPPRALRAARSPRGPTWCHVRARLDRAG